MTIPPDALDRMIPVDYAAARAMVCTGDLALCSGDQAFSKAIRWATKSPWSHVALLVRLEEADRVMALESVEKIGVRTVAFSRFITEDSERHRPYPGRILIARHEEFAGHATPERLRKMGEFAADRFGAPFSPAETWKIAARIALAGLGVDLPGRLRPKDEFICSEYVGKLYEQVGIRIPWDGRGFIGPDEFARDPKITALAQVKTR